MRRRGGSDEGRVAVGQKKPCDSGGRGWEDGGRKGEGRKEGERGGEEKDGGKQTQRRRVGLGGRCKGRRGGVANNAHT